MSEPFKTNKTQYFELVYNMHNMEHNAYKNAVGKNVLREFRESTRNDLQQQPQQYFDLRRHPEDRRIESGDILSVRAPQVWDKGKGYC